MLGVAGVGKGVPGVAGDPGVAGLSGVAGDPGVAGLSLTLVQGF